AGDQGKPARWARSAKPRRGGDPRSGPRTGACQARRLGRQLYRRVHEERRLPGGSPLHPGPGGRGRGRGRRRGRRGGLRRGPCGLGGRAGLLRRGRRRPGQQARAVQRHDGRGAGRRGHNAAGDDRPLPHPQHLPAPRGPHRPRPRRRGGRRPAPLPDGENAGRAGHRHGRHRGEGPARQGGRRRRGDPVQRTGLRRGDGAPDERRGRGRGLRLRRQGHLRRGPRLPEDARLHGALRGFERPGPALGPAGPKPEGRPLRDPPGPRPVHPHPRGAPLAGGGPVLLDRPGQPRRPHRRLLRPRRRRPSPPGPRSPQDHRQAHTHPV
ncbi:MAG: Quinone oxidoreductase, partial [uncultured Rubrobacteraceae bacterium]